MNLHQTKTKILYNLIALLPLLIGLFWGLTFRFHSVVWALICTGFTFLSAAWAGLLYGFWVAISLINKQRE